MKVLGKRMAHMLFAGMILAAMAPIAHSQPFGVELDLDGQMGNGPDTLSASIGDYIRGDIWVLGPTPILSFGFTLCNLDGSLEHQGSVSNVPATWTVSTTGLPGHCMDLTATDFTFSDPVSLPWLFHTITYQAAVDQTLASLQIDLNLSGWLNTSLESGFFSSSVGGSVQIGSTEVYGTEWGKIKSLFR